VYRARQFKISKSPGSSRYGGLSGCRVVQREILLRVSMPTLLSEGKTKRNGSYGAARATMANGGGRRGIKIIFSFFPREQEHSDLG
jgi:hypothetical protein